jgi:alcohol dehydrogenase
MRAVVIHEHGGCEQMHYESVHSPIPQGRQVLVKICAAGVNPVDFKLRKGPISDLVYPKPKILGSDMSGVVLQAPPGSPFQVGDRVFAMLPFLGSTFGSYADECVIDENLLAPAVDSVPLADLASLPLVACAIVQAMRPVRQAFHNDTRDRKCLIQAGSGGVGTFAIQYCAHVLGMYVATTCSLANFELVRSLGASETIDYHSERLVDRIQVSQSSYISLSRALSRALSLDTHSFTHSLSLSLCFLVGCWLGLRCVYRLYGISQ